MSQIKLHGGSSPVSLLEALRQKGIVLNADCGGRGVCGKCRVLFLDGAPAPSDADRSLLGEELIREGWRLACRAVIREDCTLLLPERDEESMTISTGFLGNTGPDSPAFSFDGTETVAVDIGTTTIAAVRVLKDAVCSHTAACVNHQRAFGSDVLSRIDASNKGNGPALQESVLRDLGSLVRDLGFGDTGSPKLVISANTTMQHLLQGLPCQSLGVAPYTPVDISLHTFRNMTILPGISTFVGADIVSGIIACGMDESEDLNILIDLGTNGEMVIGKKGKLLCTSTAAGPAFEGGNISCGTAGIPGAVSAVTITKDGPVIRTIRDMPAIGICGSGVLEITCELLKAGLIDETGLLDDEYFDDGYSLAGDVVFTQKDVREVQLAKSAIRAGLEVLLDEYGASYDDVKHLFLAGGFGEKINVHKAAGIGLLPEELEDKAQAVGNSSLQGAVLFAGHPDLAERFCRVADETREVSLASSPLFQELYMDHMFFPEV